MGKKKKSKHQQKVEETTSNNKPGHDASAELQSKNEADNVSEGHKPQNLDPQSTTNLTDDDKVLKKVQLDEIKPKPVLSDKNGVEVHSVLSSLNPDAKPFQIGKKGPKQATKLEEAAPLHQTNELCQCPHKCDDLVPLEARQQLFQHFYGLGEADLQNQFLRKNMDLRARNNVPESTGSGRPPRRITCKYLVPLMNENRCVEVCQKAFVSAFVITTKRVRLQREKLIASLGLNSYRSHNRGKRDDKLSINNVSDFSSDNNNDSLTLNNNTITLNSLKTKYQLPPNLSVIIPSVFQNKNPYTVDKSTTDTNSSAKKLASILGKKSLEELKELNITMEKESSTDSEREDVEIRPPVLKRARFIKRQREGTAMDNPLIPFGLVVPEGVTIAPVMGPDHDRNMAIVNNFFRNQLWKPEYIGAYS